MLCQFLIRLIENNLILPVLLHTGFQVVALDDPGDAAKVFVGIHMGSGTCLVNATLPAWIATSNGITMNV